MVRSKHPVNNFFPALADFPASRKSRRHNDYLPTLKVGQDDRCCCLGWLGSVAWKRRPVGRERSSMGEALRLQALFCGYVKFSVSTLEEVNLSHWPPPLSAGTGADVRDPTGANPLPDGGRSRPPVMRTAARFARIAGGTVQLAI
jgi:hypothetical protein